MTTADSSYTDAVDIEALAATVHQAYLDTCHRLGWPVKPQNQVPYSELSEDSKELDRASVRAVLHALTTAGWRPPTAHNHHTAALLSRVYDRAVEDILREMAASGPGLCDPCLSTLRRAADDWRDRGGDRWFIEVRAGTRTIPESTGTADDPPTSGE